MANSGDEVILITEELATSRTLPNAGDRGFLFSDDLARGESGSPSQGDDVILATPDIALGGGAITATGDISLALNQTNSPVKEEYTLSVTVDATNNLGEEQEGNLVLSIDGQDVDNESITLQANETDTVTLNWQTSEGDAGTYTAEIRSGTDSVSTTVEVTAVDKVPSGDFDLTFRRTNSPVAEGATAIVEVSLENNLSQEQDGNIVLYVNDTYVDNREVTVPAGETGYFTGLTWLDTEDEVGDNAARVESGTDQVSTTIEVEAYGGEAYQVTTSASVGDREENDWKFTQVESVPENTRLIEASISFQQEGTFWANESNVNLNIEPQGDSPKTGPIYGHDWLLYIPEGGGWGGTAVFDLGSEQSGTVLWLGADDGDSDIAPP